MKEDVFKNIVGFLIIFIHAAIFGTIFWLWLKGGFSDTELTTITGLILPIFAGFCTSIISYFVGNRYKVKHSQNMISWPFACFALLLPPFLGGAIIVVLSCQAYGVFDDFEHCKLALLAIESVLAASVARVVYAIFKPDPESLLPPH